MYALINLLKPFYNLFHIALGQISIQRPQNISVDFIKSPCGKYCPTCGGCPMNSEKSHSAKKQPISHLDEHLPEVQKLSAANHNGARKTSSANQKQVLRNASLQPTRMEHGKPANVVSQSEPSFM